MGAEDDWAIGAMILAGLKILQTMNLCFAGSFPVLLRFGIPPKQIGPFIGDTGACLNFWAAMGVILGFGFGLLNLDKLVITAWISTVTTIALFIVQVVLTYICLFCSGYAGVRRYFYWLCASALFYQSDALLCTATWGLHAAWFFLALEITNVLIPIIHWIARLFFSCCGGKDILFWKLCFQLGSMVFLTGACVLMWCVCFYKNYSRQRTPGSQDAGLDGKEKPSEKPKINLDPFTGTAETWPNLRFKQKRWTVVSPFFMGIIGMGSIFWLFPVIFPFMVCHFSHFEFTQKLNLVLGAVASLIPWALGERTKGTNGVFKGIPGIVSGDDWTTLKFHDWSGASQDDTDNKSSWWNATWLVLLPLVLFTWMFFKCLHYPRGYFGRSLLHSKWAVVWGCVYFFVSQLFKALGLNGVFLNAFLTAKVPPVGNVSFMLSMIHLTASLFTTQAYSVGYSSFKVAVDSGCNWPTQGIGGFRSYWWWHRYGVRHGTRRFFGLWKIDIVSVISS